MQCSLDTQHPPPPRENFSTLPLKNFSTFPPEISQPSPENFSTPHPENFSTLPPKILNPPPIHSPCTIKMFYKVFYTLNLLG